jgi:hypothetical protein
MHELSRPNPAQSSDGSNAISHESIKPFASQSIERSAARSQVSRTEFPLQSSDGSDAISQTSQPKFPLQSAGDASETYSTSSHAEEPGHSLGLTRPLGSREIVSEPSTIAALKVASGTITVCS